MIVLDFQERGLCLMVDNLMLRADIPRLDDLMILRIDCFRHPYSLLYELEEEGYQQLYYTVENGPRLPLSAYQRVDYC